MMRRGEIRIVDFNPALGSEASKLRPAIVVSNDDSNRAVEHLGRGVVTVVPLTSNVRRVYPYQVFLGASETGLRSDSKAQAELVRSVATERVGRRLGVLPVDLLDSLNEALRLHLAL
ncbi:MAG: type II toxin-antitoxin system PemK/MazF family toxin [bacterium]|nr:type II toxin-antitoxin system PemK/MazF family toxin [bacterium]MCY3924849.1 type II toxin-antitoxin system PemK/MazF family toxin [bacterium]MCY3953256.1 type II toxin-antitoxin system PemK/MazF family toxin [bacterium]MCY4103459.1 type II toxin-antitoxin system PemK/MazF family toxin [bacterium]